MIKTGLKRSTILQYKTYRNVCLGIGFLLVYVSCQTNHDLKSEVRKVEQLALSGEMKRAAVLTDSIKSVGDLSEKELIQIDSILEISRRIQLDFSLNESDVKRQLLVYYPELNDSMLRGWEKNNKLEMRLIDGEKRYFKNAASNLFRLDDKAAKRKVQVEGCSVDSLKLFCLKHTQQIIEKTESSRRPVLPVKMKLTYTIRLKPNAVPDGEIVRCWMPFPRTGNVRQNNIKLIGSDLENSEVAPESSLQRSVYLEKKSVSDQPTVFKIEMEVETAAQYFNLNPDEIKPYNTRSEIYQEYTRERLPQIAFTNEIRKLGEQICSKETNPLKKVQKIYDWINDSIHWASALEYCTMSDIPDYVLENGHGDCGMQTLLFMTLARSQGIPVKWQSGWMLHPGNINLHDWCEVYYEGIGWVPLDQSFGLQLSTNENIHNFYRSGIDSYRLIVNDDYARELTPKKKFMRSEPYDFQRGELEWKGGNLYFDQWNWHMDVKYE